MFAMVILAAFCLVMLVDCGELTAANEGLRAGLVRMEVRCLRF